MSGRSGQNWELSYNAPAKPIDLPEPKHRVPAEGVTKGISFRALPKSCVEQVRDICVHYVEKCSGKYSKNAAAARYVHQMAEEVINQLAGVAADIKRHVDEPEVLQKLLDDWNDSFPPSLGELGTPKAIAAKLERQNREIEDLTASLEHARVSHEHDIGGVLRSVDAQLEASRKGVMSERRQLSLRMQHTIDSNASLVADMKRDHENVLRRTKEYAERAALVANMEHQKEVESLQARIEQVESDAKAKEDAFRALLMKERSRAAKNKASMRKKLKAVQEKYHALRAGQSALNGEESVGDGESTFSGFTTMSDEDGELNEFGEDEEAILGLMANTDKNGEMGEGPQLSSLAVGRQGGRSSAGSGAAGGKSSFANNYRSSDKATIKSLRMQHGAVVADLQRTVGELERQKKNVEDLLETLELEKKRSADLSQENKALHYTMKQCSDNLPPQYTTNRPKSRGSQVQVDENNVPIRIAVKEGKLIQAQPKVLKHTPHFLQQTRKYAL